MDHKLLLSIAFAAGTLFAQAPQTIITGLQAPQRLLLTPRGNFLVTETSMSINAARVSFVSRGGTRRSLFEGLPSGVDVTLAGGGGPTAMALKDRTLYLAIGAGDSERRGTAPTSVYNPAGESSPIFSSVLKIQFGSDVDVLAGTFKFTPQIQQQLADGDDVDLSDGAGGTARVSVLCDFPDGVPDANTLYRFSNPYSLVLTPDGGTLYMTDASQDTLVKIDTATGRWRRLLRFPKGQNPTPIGPPVIDAVPTQVRLFGDGLLVTQLTGFPFLKDAARIFTVDIEKRTIAPFFYFLTSAIDVLVRPRAGTRPQFFTLEFSLAQTATPPGPGRLLRWDTAEPVVMSAALPAPVSMVLDEQTNSVIVLTLTGSILEFKL
ncbi:MAG TPA: ScyD/ScyE family protein [Bryobacteraceae bacterium]|nr:ScyD/ScyE family protein [Bryobacteraceae bacterium]